MKNVNSRFSQVSRMRLAAPLIALWSGLGSALAIGQSNPWLIFSMSILLALIWLSRRIRFQIWQVLGFWFLGLVLIAIRMIGAEVSPTQLGNHQIHFQVLADAYEKSDGFGSLNFEKKVSVLVNIIQLDGVEAESPLTVSLTAKAAGFRIGSKWKCTAEISEAPPKRRYLAYGRCRDDLEQTAESNFLLQFADRVRTAAISSVESLEPTKAAGLLPALSLGDTSMQSPITEHLLQASGLGHLTAVSGANVAIMLMAVELLLRRTRLNRKSRILLQLLSLGIFVLVVRPTPSVVRAAAMAGLTLWAMWLGRARQAESILLASALGLLVIDPYLARSWGFALSVAATAGLIMLSPIFLNLQNRNQKKANPLKKIFFLAFITALSASIATLPVLVLMGAAPTFASIPANLFAEFFVAPATIAGLVAALIQLVAEIVPFALPLHFLAQSIAQIGVWSASGIVKVAQLALNSPFDIEVLSIQGICILGLTLGLWWRFKKVLFAILGFAILLTSLNIASRFQNKWPPTDWQIVACDVGQGDATVIRSQNRIMLVDAGGDAVALFDCLSQLEISRIDIFVATHFHADHVGGVLALADFEVENWLSPCAYEPRLGLALVEGVLKKPPIQAQNKMVGQFASATWRVMSCGENTSSTGSDINNSTLVLSVSESVGKTWNLLLTGDIETETQTQIMANYAPGAFTFTKIPHHGSLSQNPDFAKWSGARVGWVSVGLENDYGHPATETLAQYDNAGIKIFSTALCGAIAFSADSIQSEHPCGFE